MRLLLIILVLATSNGCSLLRSRYAMDDPIYARKYAEGASKQDLPGKIKQAIDARHTQYLDGWLVSAGAQVRPRTGNALGTVELGRELYQTNYFTSRLAFSGVAGNESTSVGMDVGVRLQAPARLAPFVGVGGFAGILLQDAVTAYFDSATESEDLFSSTEDDSSKTIDEMAAFYPEIGMHFWLDGRIRLTAFGRYLITTEGREFDDWLVGGQIAIFNR